MKYGIVFICLALAPTYSPVGAATINFDSFPGISFLGGDLIPLESRLSDQLLATTGARFSTEGVTNFVAVVDLKTGSPPHAPSNPNGIGASSSGGFLTYSSPIRVSFFDPADSEAPATTDSVSVQGDIRGDGRGNVHLNAFDVDGTLLRSSSAFDTISGGPGIQTVSSPGIHYVIVWSDNGTVAFDNFVFNEVQRISDLKIETAVLLRYRTVLGTTFTIEESTDFEEWADSIANVEGDGLEMSSFLR